MNTEAFERRHIGPSDEEVKEMLSLIKANSIEELINQTIPESIRNKAVSYTHLTLPTR